jgi:anti-anti-sigma factor
MAATSEALSLGIAPDGAIMVVGELDMASADDFMKAATWIIERRHEVVLDIAELSFIDSAGLRAIVRLAEEACPHGIVLRSPTAQTLRLLDVLGIEDFPRIRVERP